MTRAVRPSAPIPSAPSARAAGPAGQEFIDLGSLAGDHPVHDGTGEPDFPAIQRSPEFAQLRRRLRLFVFPMSLLFFCWYMTFALFAAYGHEFMSRKVTGEINIGTVFGLLQFVSTITIVLTYSRFAKRKIDPRVDEIHELAGVVKE
jgi:uncharacterized membrane protein (DUF485 family)